MGRGLRQCAAMTPEGSGLSSKSYEAQDCDRRGQWNAEPADKPDSSEVQRGSPGPAEVVVQPRGGAVPVERDSDQE